MKGSDAQRIDYPQIGVCGLSCRLCPLYQTDAPSRCDGCKSPSGRMAVGCRYITCALKKKGIEFCWDCGEGAGCETWEKTRVFSREHDSPKCYQTLEADIAFVQERGVKEFDRLQKERERLLRVMLRDFNDGRSRSRYCVAATVLPVEDLRTSIARARKDTKGLDVKERAKTMRSILEGAASERGLNLRLRK